MPIDIQTMQSDVLLPFAGALTGIILATIGIIMGSISAIYNAVASKASQKNRNDILAALDSLDAMVKELKWDCLIVVTSFGVLLLCYLFSRMDIPYISSSSCSCLGKIRILSSASIFVLILSFWAIYDTVAAVFTLHKHTSQISRSELK
jgi:hypothetical protein